MRTIKLLIIIILSSHTILAQVPDFEINDRIVEQIPNSVKIIGLGDPTHQERTITNYRIDLIKKLVNKKQFKIIAIEGNIVELYSAYTKFLNDSNFSHFDDAMYPMLNIEEMNSLYEFVQEEIQKGNQIKIIGFDATFSGNTYTSEAKAKIDELTFLKNNEKIDFLNNLSKAAKTNIWAIFRNNKKIKKSLVEYSTKITRHYLPQNLGDYVFVQSLKNIIFLYGDSLNIPRDNKRDLAMADNVAFIQQIFPNEKIVLFGSSTHLLKNPSSIDSPFYKGNVNILGHELNKKDKESYYYIAYSGVSGFRWKFWNKEKKLPKLIDNSIEKLNTSLNETATFHTPFSAKTDNYSSRFLGHQFLSLNLWKVMDMIVLIRNIKPGEI